MTSLVNSERICIVAARRTPQGRFMGALSKYSALQLAAAAAGAALSKINPELVDLTVVGHCLAPDHNIARQTAREVGIPLASPAYTVNMACASGMKAVMLAADAIRLGQARVVLAGGTESMTNAPHQVDRVRFGVKLGSFEMRDALVDALADQQLGESMGVTAERLAEQYGISRASQDEFAYNSHRKAVAAQDSGAFESEIISLPELSCDEQPRRDSSVAKLASLKPAFKSDGTVTPGNASSINDGAAMLVLCGERTAEKHGWQPMAILAAAAQVGCDPRVMGIGPVPAAEKLFSEQNLALSDMDAIEINEAFAAQALACAHRLKLSPDDSRFNSNGSGISLGHPIGTTGARLLVHLAHRTNLGLLRKSLAAVCVGGGQGVAAMVSGVRV